MLALADDGILDTAVDTGVTVDGPKEDDDKGVGRDRRRRTSKQPPGGKLDKKEKKKKKPDMKRKRLPDDDDEEEGEEEEGEDNDDPPGGKEDVQDNDDKIAGWDVDKDNEDEEDEEEEPDMKRRRPSCKAKPKPRAKTKAKAKAKHMQHVEKKGGEKKDDEKKDPPRDQCKNKKLNDIWNSLELSLQDYVNGLGRAERTDFVNNCIERKDGRLVVKKDLMFKHMKTKEEKQKGQEQMAGYCLVDQRGLFFSKPPTYT